MKSLVASFCLIASVAFAATSRLGQTTHRGRTNGPVKARTETLRICQGLPLPDGYIIIAYMTSSVCPHGAYLLKKQDVDFQPSPVANRTVRQPANGPAETEIQYRTITYD